MMSPQVIKHFNDPNNAITLGGLAVRREKEIYLRTRHAYVPVLQTSMHFCFVDTTVPRGTTLFCTCGAPGVIVGYEAYRKYSSFLAHEVIACHNFIMYGVHADGSHE